ncbi:MAG: ABC transporter substrate-binding protein [Thermodesulfobacteriota bacterium]|nr:ABC transporter substrate-binding protein [Thermodesulfobacteriota bacterium]
MTQMKSTVDDIMAILNDENLKESKAWPEKKTLIRTVVDHRFDFEEMSKRSLAKTWRKRTDEEKEYFVSLFSKLLQNTYINRVESYSDEVVIFQKQAIKGKKAVVYTIISATSMEIPVIYKLMQQGDDWFVYDVIIEGVSLVRNYRSQFSKIVSREKYAGLIKRVEEKVNKIDESSVSN